MQASHDFYPRHQGSRHDNIHRPRNRSTKPSIEYCSCREGNSVKCVTCCKDFGENHTNYDRHMGSKEHLGRLFNKKSSVAVAERREDGVVGAPPTPNTGIPSVLPPPSLMMAPVRTQAFTTPSIPDTLPPVNWKKWAMGKKGFRN